MAKARSKAPYARVIQKYKKNVVGTWNKNAAELVDRIDHAREGGSLEQITGCALLADSRLSIQESARFGDIYLAIYGEKSKAPHMPGTIAAWERNPKYVRLSRDAIYQFEYSRRSPEPALLSNLDAYFPGCLLIDVSEIEWECGYSGEKVDAVFVYPSYDEFEELPALRYVGVSHDVQTVWYSCLLLKGGTVDEARAYTGDADKRHRASMIATEEDRLAYESLRDIFEMIDSEKEDLNNLMDRLLGLMLDGILASEEAEYDGHALHLKLISRFEAEEKAKYKKLAETLLAGEARRVEDDALKASSLKRHAGGLAEENGDDGVETFADQDEEFCLSLREEISRLREALVLAGDRYEQLQSRVDADKATFLHHVHEVESRCRKLEKRNAALEKRAVLIDELEIPKTSCDALALAKKAYPDKLLFLDQAMKSAESFDGRSAGEVWALLRSMATVLHPLIFGDKKGDIAKIYQAESGFELALRDAKELKHNPKCVKERTVRYEGQPDGVVMIAHVKGRSSRMGEALRVHFFPDHDSQLLVIGHCGDHLPA